MKKISATIITLNEEDKIARCLESLMDVADEIVVVDSLSTDNTKSICEEYGVRFVEQKWLGYSEQKNLANKLATYDWILSIDADEVLSDELRKSILKIKNTDTDIVYSFNRLNNYCGKWIRHCGLYPDRKIRIWNRNVGQWEGYIHETIKFSKNIKEENLKGDLLHFSFSTHDDFKKQLYKFAKMRGEQYFQKGKKNAALLGVLSPIFSFVKNYFIKLGFLDGKEGFRICLVYAQATKYKYEILRQLKIENCQN